MTDLCAKVFRAMFEYENGVTHRIQHFTKVHNYAALIAMGENVDKETEELIELTAMVHDIGIKPALEKYGSSAGPYQEKEGEIVSKELLRECGVDEKSIERISYIVGHHHTYKGVDGIDWQIILEADFLVNGFEEKLSKDAIIRSRDTWFKTETGKTLLNQMFGLEQ